MTKENAEKTISSTPRQSERASPARLWLQQHRIANQKAFKQFSIKPLSNTLTVIVIAIALSLPMAMQVLINNLHAGQNTLNSQAKINLYLKKSVTQHDIETLIQHLKTNQDLQDVHRIPPNQALNTFLQNSQLGQETNLLQSNPLPETLVITPDTQVLSDVDIKLLVQDFATLDSVDIAQADNDWITKLFSIIDLAQHFTIGLSLFLIFAVFALIGTSIKSLAQDFQDEILISKLFGATDAYVRRTFLYSGLFYGVAGAILSLVFVYIAILWITPKLKDISKLYESHFSIIPPNLEEITLLLATGIVLGLGGAWVASNRIISRLSL